MQGTASFDLLHPRVQRWVWARGWKSLREIQDRSIPLVLGGERDVILSASTAAGKTEAAFLPLCSQLADDWGGSVRVLCVSPLKALINDQFERLESLCSSVDVPVHRWHGDVAQGERRRLGDDPSGVLLITPESLEAMFVRRGDQVGAMFRQLRAVVLDEVHAYIGSPRGRQLQSLLQRLETVLNRKVRRIGLSATLGDMSLAAQYLRPADPHLVELVESAGDGKDVLLKLRGYRERAPEVVAHSIGDHDGVRGGDTAGEGDPDEWHVQAIAYHLYARLRGGHHLVFANARATVEQYADRLRRMSERARVPNEFLPHHGSLSKEIREDTEARLKDRSRPATAICTSTLELGIDIGDVGSIAQIGAPFSVSSLRQRLGRSGRRDNSPTLRLYVSEPEITGDNPVLDTLHTELVQAVAMLDLLLARWCEPPDLGALHLSTLVQQVLSMIAERGGLRPKQAWSVLCERGPFASVQQDRFASLLRCMGKSELIEQSPDGELLLGGKGERIVEHFSFYAVFSTPEEFRVEHAGRALGTLAIDLSLAEGMHIIFAGRRWRVQGIDPDAKIVSVVPAPGGRTPRFEGSRGGLVHDRIRCRMREVLESGDRPPFIDEEGASMLTQARRAYVRLGLHEASLIADGKNSLLFLCRGDRIMSTVAVMLVARGLAPEVTGPAISVEGVGVAALRGHLRALVSEPPPNPEHLASAVGNKHSGKYDWVLDESLLCAEYAARSLDVAGAVAALKRLAE